MGSYEIVSKVNMPECEHSEPFPEEVVLEPRSGAS